MKIVKALLIVVASAGVLASTGVAGASNGKERVLVDRFDEPYSFAVDCAGFGYAFEIEVAGTQRVRVTDVLANDGTLLQTVFHIALRETDTNSVSGKSVPLHGTVHEVWDYASNTRTISGSVFVGNAPGGKWVQDTGRITMTLDTRIATFVAGPHQAFFTPGGLDALACAALA
jgi:hypothetical protein